ncbi:hypothetical protein M3148_11550 [Georgenia satyanarayanai]|uniref:hypothetical protein n=1 Tax=Georgenia satyanarayanai TaxID=860221 RepID=UPI0020410D82|nr:hypothetical protein [Georgenia satyanarayanai]MCM3661619.1 hypothetical protein [Georgenia satyanarayanai]
MLDATTLYVVSIVVVTIVATTFVVEVASRGRSPVDLLWTLALSSAATTAVFYVAATASGTLWWFVALGNASSVVTTLAMWNGIRADGGRRPLLGVTLGAAAVTALATLLAGPDAGEWGGGWAVLLGTAAGGLLGGVEALRRRWMQHRLGVVLGGVLLLVGVYYSARLAVYLAQGPDSPTFTRALGTSTTLLVLIVLITTAGYCMVVIRTDEVHTREIRASAFDPQTGLRTPATFLPRAAEATREAKRAGDPLAVVVVVVEGRGDLTTGFHRDVAEAALVAVVDSARVLAPPSNSFAGRVDDDASDVFEVLLRGFTGVEAHAWAENLRRRVIAVPLQVDGARLRLRVSLGVAADAETGYELDALRELAARRAKRAVAEGGNRVLSWL